MAYSCFQPFGSLWCSPVVLACSARLWCSDPSDPSACAQAGRHQLDLLVSNLANRSLGEKESNELPTNMALMVSHALATEAGGEWVDVEEFEALFLRAKNETFRWWTLKRFGVEKLADFFALCPPGMIDVRTRESGQVEVRSLMDCKRAREACVVPVKLVRLVRSILVQEHTSVDGLRWVPVSVFQDVFVKFHKSGRPFAVETLKRFGVYSLEEFFERCPVTSIRRRTMNGELEVQAAIIDSPLADRSVYHPDQWKRLGLPTSLVSLARKVLMSVEARHPVTGCVQWIPVQHFQHLQRTCASFRFRFETLSRFGVKTPEEFFARCPRHIINRRVVDGRMQVIAVTDK